MNEKDFINLMRDVERHEDAVMEDAKEIRRLKVDVWELSNLVRLLAAFVPRPVSGIGGGKGGNRIRNAATGGTSETWNRELSTFECWDKILLPEPPRAFLHFYAKRS
jgi:hypothetical protein